MNMADDDLIVYSSLLKLRNGSLLLDIDRLNIRRSECILLTGCNGSGKTTLLKILAGLERPERCFVQYQGNSMRWDRANIASRGQIIYLHQQAYLFDASVFDNIAYGLRRGGCSRARIRQQVEEALQWSDLGHLRQRNAKQLSGGERQRVALARARILQPQLLLMDEPTASMDRQAREQAYFLIRRLSHEGVAVLVTSHQHQRLQPLADRHMELHKGRLCPAPAHTADPVAAREADAPGEASIARLPGPDQRNSDRHA